MNVSLGVFDKTEITCVRMGSAKIVTTVILPTYGNSLWIHEFNTYLTFFHVHPIHVKMADHAMLSEQTFIVNVLRITSVDYVQVIHVIKYYQANNFKL
jgi:hypothetical protein